MSESVHRVIDDFTPEQLQKLKAMRAAERMRHVSALSSSSEKLLGELGLYYGWEAVRDAMNDLIDADTMIALIMVGREHHQRQRIELVADIAQAVLNATGKEGNKAVKTHLRNLEKGL